MSFYVSLPSHSSKGEFPKNVSNHFKIRLPNPIRLEGLGWKVGMSSITLPDDQVTLFSLSPTDPDDKKVTLASYAWQRLFGSGHNLGATNFDTEDLKAVFQNVDGVGFMKSMIAYFQRQRIFADNGPKLGSKYVTSDGKITYIDFKWEGGELVTRNADTLRPITDMPALHFNVDLAIKMGWLVKNGSTYELGPNLQIEFFKDEIPDIGIIGDLHDSDGLPAFWVVEKKSSGESFLKLSIYCDWRFLNLNKAFEAVVGSTSRSLFVYSDVGGSSVVGNQVTDLLREVNLIRKGEGTQYFEPYHIQYIPVRKDVLDIIEVQVAETTGNLVKFGSGNTIVTLHFKKS